MPRTSKARNVCTSRKERWLSIQGAITAATATNFEKQLAKLADENNLPIVVFLESIGGRVFACLKIHRLITNLVEKQVPVHTVGVRIVRSGAFFILQAGARRFATKATKFMFHQAVKDSFNSPPNSHELLEEAHQLILLDATQLLIFIKRGEPIREIRELFMRDAEIGTRTARKLNLVDAIIERDSFSKMRERIVS